MKTIKQFINKSLSRLPLWGLGGLLLLSSCTKVDLEEPLKGKITLATDWSKRTSGIDIPASYTVNINNQTLNFSQASNLLPELEVGTYPIQIYNTPEKISLSGTTATVATTGNVVDAQPGWLFTAISEAQYADFKVETITVPMKQQVRQLTVTLNVTEGDPARIATTSGTLSGVANALDFKTNTHSGTNLSVVPVFTRSGNKLTATVRLIGLSNQAQKLTLTINFTDGRTQAIESDMSALLANFNSDKHQPLEVSANLNTPIETGFSATINGWKMQASSGGVAW